MSQLTIKENELLIKLRLNSTFGLMKRHSRKYYVERFRFYEIFKEPMNEVVNDYSNNRKEKKESWQTCNIEFLRYKLKNHLTRFELTSVPRFRKRSLVSIINYALMLYQRESMK